MASLVDTNILVYRCDPRFPTKRETARSLLRQGLVRDSLRFPHQELVEFVSGVTRVWSDGCSLLPREKVWRQAEELLAEFPILYPNAHVFRTALRGMPTYRLSWVDAHLWP